MTFTAIYRGKKSALLQNDIVFFLINVFRCQENKAFNSKITYVLTTWRHYNCIVDPNN